MKHSRAEQARAELAARKLDALEQLACVDFYAFVRVMWRSVEPKTAFVPNWHVRTVCREIQAVVENGGDLAISLPPGYAKSLLTSVFLPAWAWLRDPNEQTLYLSGVEGVYKRDSDKARRVVRHPMYTRLVSRRVLALRAALQRGESPELGAYAAIVRSDSPQPWGLSRSKTAIDAFGTELGGMRYAQTYGAGVTGHRTRIQVVDDAVDAKTVVLLDAARQAEAFSDCVRVYDQVLQSRVSPFRGCRIVIAQRLHEDDLPGVLQRREGWRYVVVPEEFDPDRIDIHPDDPRTGRGELAFPLVYTEGEVAKRKRSWGQRQYEAQGNQNPAPSTGGMFDAALKAVHWYMDDPHVLGNSAGHTIILSIDATGGSESTTASRCSIQAWSKLGARRHLLWDDSERMNWVETRRRAREASKLWPRLRKCIVEKKALGKALIEDLSASVPNVEAYDPDGGKVPRAWILVYAMEAGQVWAPHPDNPHVHKVAVPFRDIVALLAEAERNGEQWPAGIVEGADGLCWVPWPVLWRAELARFPGGRHDDRVDASSCAAIKLGEMAAAPGETSRRMWEVLAGGG